MTNILNSLMSGGYEPDIDTDFVVNISGQPTLADEPIGGLDDPEHEDLRKYYLENYAAEAAGHVEDELPF